MIIEGRISGLASHAHLVDFRLGKRRVCIERTAASARLRNGDRIRASVQEPADDRHFHITAFQGLGEAATHYASPQLGSCVMLLGGVLIATGLLTGAAYLLVSAASLMAFDLLIASDRAAVLARLRAS